MPREVSLLTYWLLTWLTGSFSTTSFPLSLLYTPRGAWVHLVNFFYATRPIRQPFIFSRGFPVRCCIVVKHLGRAELGMNDSPSQSPPVKRPCPDAQVSLTLLYSPVGSDSLSSYPRISSPTPFCFFLTMLRYRNNPRKASSSRTG